MIAENEQSPSICISIVIELCSALDRAPMISPMAEALISFPVEICLKDAVSATLETNWTTLCTMVLENRLMSVMRFQKGDVRSLYPMHFMLCTSLFFKMGHRRSSFHDVVIRSPVVPMSLSGGRT